MKRTVRKFSESWRITWAIAAKDIVDALRNKTTLSIVVGVAFLMFTAMAGPLLLGLKDTPSAVVYDPGKSALIKALTARSEFRLRLADSLEEVKTVVVESPNVLLGLAIPPDFGPGGSVVLDGYAAHWADPALVAERAAFFEEQLGQASSQAVRINTAGRVIYPSLDAGGQPFMISLALTIMILAVGFALVPYLLVEEKETHTFEALLVSPARFSQVAAGKALAGACYCLSAAVVVFLFNAKLFVHWEVAILAVLLGAAFAVAVGLLMGALFDNPATINLWVGVLFMLLLVPTFLAALDSTKVPEVVRTITPWLPSVALGRLLKIAMAGDVPAALLWPNVAVLAVSALVVYALVVWRVRRSDR